MFLNMADIIRKSLAELVGTYIFVLFGPQEKECHYEFPCKRDPWSSDTRYCCSKLNTVCNIIAEE